jgi:hypothetical protein
VTFFLIPKVPKLLPNPACPSRVLFIVHLGKAHYLYACGEIERCTSELGLTFAVDIRGVAALPNGVYVASGAEPTHRAFANLDGEEWDSDYAPTEIRPATPEEWASFRLGSHIWSDECIEEAAG